MPTMQAYFMCPKCKDAELIPMPETFLIKEIEGVVHCWGSYYCPSCHYVVNERFY